MGRHLLYFTRNIRVSQSKHAHLHKYVVKHTLAAPGRGCGGGSESEASPASRLASHRGCYAKEREGGKKNSKQRVGRREAVRDLNMFGPSDILQVRKFGGSGMFLLLLLWRDGKQLR